MRRPPRSGVSDEHLTMAWQSVSLLLDYPDPALLERLDLLRTVAQRLPASLAGPLTGFVQHLAVTPLPQLQAAYVETFDSRRRSNLFLTYFAHGDTRKRGLALLRFKQTYQAAGFAVSDAELPDHLCVVLEFAATVDRDRGRQLLLDHRAGLELLRLSLRDADSPWAGLLEVVAATLPPLCGEERDAVARLAVVGPPEEEVGLAPFARPEFTVGGPTLLGMPSLPGARA